MCVAVDEACGSGRSVRGWVAFHRQDLDRVVESGVLCLAFASVTDDDAGFRGVGNELAELLIAAGFVVDWDGDPDRRLELKGVEWKKRRNTLRG
jgi:hypothetical protein